MQIRDTDVKIYSSIYRVYSSLLISDVGVNVVIFNVKT